MSKKEDHEDGNWQEAHRQAARLGIVLTRRKDSQGNYVCYPDKKSKNLLFRL